ncbi:MAG TPA: glucosamine-6-phosphate deaminase [Phycisphaerales bacterium]|nr:glucosamine-6-phosphate deaminase [Phycisphaerales bacterium]HCD34067.1 glucosamine-6-phosphate deaminase [Phycisphaerales bacterium]
MKHVIHPTKQQSGAQAASEGAKAIRKAIEEKGSARIIVATGASQFDMLSALIKESDIAWDKVTAFHLDEYVGIPITHPASFRLYLWQRFVSQLALPLASFTYLNGEDDPQAQCKIAGKLIAQQPIDVAFVGIGENGHLAFNDPPADFETTEPYLVVNLDEACRKQQLGEGWFPRLDAVPVQAISMSCQQILKSKTIICTVPDERKSLAVKQAIQGPVTNQLPASILQQHANTTIYLDEAAASKL